MWIEEHINQFDDKGLKHGYWKNFVYHSDTIASEESYSHGIRNGFCRYFYITGVLRSEGVFKNGSEIGLWNFYSYYDYSPILKEIIYIR